MFADIELARRLEQTEGFAGAAFVEARGGESTSARIAGCYVMFDGVASPLTQTFALGMTEPATGSVLSEVEDFFKTRGSPVLHEVCPLAGVPLMQTLAERGYVPYEASNVLFMELAGVPERAACGFTVRLATNQDEDAYSRTSAQGWSENEQMAEMIAEFARVMFKAEGFQGFLVEQDGTAVATAGLVIRSGVALFAGASTILPARGQGAQRVVLAERLQHASQAGCDLAMMVTEPGSASQRNAERSGFQIAYTRIKWRLQAR